MGKVATALLVVLFEILPTTNRPTMRVLGLGGSGGHDSSACVVRDGEVLFAIEEERLNREKHCLKTGERLRQALSMEYCLDAVGWSLDDVDLIVGNDIMSPIFFSKVADRIQLLNHHLTHAASAYYTSGFADAAIVVVDGFGSQLPGVRSIAPKIPGTSETISTYMAVNGQITELTKFGGWVAPGDGHPGFQNSLGAFYLLVTTELGFKFLEEGKTMGLAAYGGDRYVGQMGQYYRRGADAGGFSFTITDMRSLQRFMREEISAARNEEEDFQVRADLAAAAQSHLELVLIDIANELRARTGATALCFAGGVALNSVANQKILNSAGFDQLFVPPGCGDAGTAIGAALYGYYGASTEPYHARKPPPAYMGKQYSPDEMEAALAPHASELLVTDVGPKEVARELASGRILGYFQGRSEFGPRALGGRSILADPRSAAMKEIINARVKHREAFRPFAPVVTRERVAEYFDTHVPSPYMLLVADVRENMRSAIPAVTHVDGTARYQTVDARDSPELAALLEAFCELTGVPVLLNTSFNDNGEPIVETPDDAVRCLLRLDLDGLVLGERLVRKRR